MEKKKLEEIKQFVEENKDFFNDMFRDNLFAYEVDYIVKYLLEKNISKKLILDAQIDDTTSSIEDIGRNLEISYGDFFSYNKKYLNRALYFLENYKKEDIYYAKLLYSLGTFYQFINSIDEERYIPLYKKALRIYKKFLDRNHIDIGKIYYKLGDYYTDIYKYEKRGEILLQNALKIMELNYGIDDDLVSIRDNLRVSFDNRDNFFFTNSSNSNLSCKVDRVEIENFKIFKSFEVDFSNQVNIIIGQNAMGKTALLQAITLALLKENSPDEFRYYKRFINKSSSSANIKIYFDKYIKNIKIFKDRREIDNNYFTPFVLAYGSNFFTEYYLDPKHKIKEILNKTINSDFVNSIFENYVTDFENPLRILEVLEFSRNKRAKEIQRIFLETINLFLEEYKIVSNEDGDFFFIKDGDENIQFDLDDLSEGYRSNVLLISDMLIKILGVGCTPKSIEGIILIDEFDKHLHPRWQSRLVNQLKETFPKIQFIMTTHNPMSILDREADEIIILEDIDGKIVAKKGRGTKSIDVSIVLLEYFGVEATVGDEMREKINSFNRLKLKKDLTKDEKKELEELEKFLGSTIASNFIYDRKYLKFLEFLRDHKDIDFDKYEKITDDEMNQLLEDFGDFFDD